MKELECFGCGCRECRTWARGWKEVALLVAEVAGAWRLPGRPEQPGPAHRCLVAAC